MSLDFNEAAGIGGQAERLMQLQANLAAHEADIIANATVWTAFMRAGPGRVVRGEFSTRAEAEAFAGDVSQGRAVMIYAVTAQGRSTMVGSIRA